MAIFAVIAIIVWLGVMFTWWLVSSAFRKTDTDRIKNRLLGGPRSKKLKTAAGPNLIQQEAGAGKLVIRLLHKYRLHARLQELIEQAGLKWNVARLIHGCVGMFLIGSAGPWLVLPGQFRRVAFLFGLAASTLPVLYLLRARKRRLRRFEELFPDSLEFLARSMRAGHAFSVSLEMICREFQEPLAGEFRRTFEEHNLGLPLDFALQKMAKRVPSLDVHFFVSAVLLQRRTGGNLAEILDKLAYIIRERFKLRGKIRAISAHGRMTGIALTCIPAGVAVLMFFSNPDYVKFFFTDLTGNYMLAAGVTLQIVGYLIMQKIVTIEV